MGTMDLVEVATTPTPKKQRGRSRKSVVWEHFTIMNVGGDCFKACCNQCKKSYAYSNGQKMSGTSHLKRHIDTGTCSVLRMKDKNLPVGLELKSLEPPKKRKRATKGAFAVPFSQQRCNHEIAKMIILHDYPLEMVEHPGFTEFVKTLQPRFETVSSKAIYDECMAIFSSEKSNLTNILSEIPGRISLSLDMWTSDETLGYAVLSGHFIDNEWKLHRRLLNVVTVPFPDSEKAFNHAILSCLSGWGAETKLFALTLDRSIANEAAINNLRSLLSINNPHMLNGQFLIGSCFAHILTSLALDSIHAMNETVQRVRNCVKFVKTSEATEEKFMEIKAQLQVPSNKTLVIDNRTRWDSTYHMLCAASELKEVFACLDTLDKPYTDLLSLEEWRQIETLCDYLNCLYDASGVVTAQKYPTADKFFAQVCTIQLKLFNSLMSEDPFESNLIKPLIEKFENYWKDCSFVLAMAVVMDPRYKLKLVGHFFSQLYREQAESFLSTVKDAIKALYLEYVAESLPFLSFDIEERDEEEAKTTTDHEQEELPAAACDDPFFDIYISDISSNEHTKSELDHYLEEYLQAEHEDFNILEWWKVNSIRYPTLSNMAADLLSMPLSTVPSESVFDTVCKKVDRGSLIKPEAIEAFVCSKDWLRSAVKENEF